MIEGGRQVAPTVAGIRADHVARYEFAAREIKALGDWRMLFPRPPRVVVDAGCGCGYGSAILAAAGFEVEGIDVDAGAVAYGNAHYAAPTIHRRVGDFSRPETLAGIDGDAVVAFEVIEHIEDPSVFLRGAGAVAPVLIGSVPNEETIPFDPARQVYHFRHYTIDQIVDLLAECGWTMTHSFGQAGKRGRAAEVDTAGTIRDAHTIVFVAARTERVRA